MFCCSQSHLSSSFVNVNIDEIPARHQWTKHSSIFQNHNIYFSLRDAATKSNSLFCSPSEHVHDHLLRYRLLTFDPRLLFFRRVFVFYSKDNTPFGGRLVHSERRKTKNSPVPLLVSLSSNGIKDQDPAVPFVTAEIDPCQAWRMRTHCRPLTPE